MSKQIKLVIPQIPESYNKISTWHWAKRDKYNQIWYWEIKSVWLFYLQDHPQAQELLLPFKKAKIDFYIYFPSKHRRDKLNYALGLKAALDQIAKEGIIVDDNWDRIEDNYYSRIDKENQRVEITIVEVKKGA